MDNLQVISRCFRRPVFASVLVATTVVAVLLPPAHIHLAMHDDRDHDHVAAVEHSHWAGHHASGAAFDDDDGSVIFVDHPAVTSEVASSVARPVAAIVATLQLPAGAVFTAVDRPTSGNSPRDGPGRHAPSFRGPPLVL